FDEFTLLDVEIKTGRTHQIRVHLTHLKHPVVGDLTYDSGRANMLKSPRLRAAITNLGRPFLHAARLSFTHPTSGERLNFNAPLPTGLKRFWKCCARRSKTDVTNAAATHHSLPSTRLISTSNHCRPSCQIRNVVVST